MLELLNVNPSSGEPIYRQLHDQIVRLIVGGQLQPEDVLPSVRQLAEHLAVNPMTVSRAMQQLVDQGWVERRRGQPSRVAARTSANNASGSSLLAPQISALVEQAQQLGVEYDELQQLLKQFWQKE
ncbi:MULTISPECIES: GntR family transcriptional regulator [Shewanella]|uniref:GntR family transcriptional regulator n=2 Tax=Shewanella TaxID=22 RepID=A0A9X1Z2V5_9GAMM|nr:MULTISPECIES: GntR family transcriptional regulator [Shewanella]MCL1101280.1 GntR family transcriptional regulator [Shewanella saliphila]MCL1104631.1 GntR family transcriptional regulator [Shewanella algicola]GGP47590.1 GntR family transcriptional regulator [Shewanella saliphila]GGP54287.1 GntR family transcriptional regulator [Shewanella algicola]